MQSRKIAQLHGLWFLGEHPASLDELLCRLLFTLRIDNLCPSQPLGLSLFGDGADHALIEIDMLDLHISYLDAPGVGLLVENLLDIAIELVTFRQHLIKLVLAKYRAQRGLRQLTGCGHKVFHPDD